MDHKGFHFVDRTGVEAPKKLDLIPAVTIPKKAIDEEIERFARLPAPANGRRVSGIANPLTSVVEGVKYPWKAGDLCSQLPAGRSITMPRSMKTYKSSPSRTARSISGRVLCCSRRVWISRSNCSSRMRASRRIELLYFQECRRYPAGTPHQSHM